MATKKTRTVSGTKVPYTGSNSTSVIDVIKVYGKSNTIKARNGNDQITVYAGTGHKIYGDAGADTIVVKKGSSHKIYGGTGNDKITLSGGSKNLIYGQAGNDTFTVTSTVGTGNKVYGSAGTDTFTIKGGSGNYYYGGDGGDKFTLSGGTQYVDGGTGADKITVSGGNKHTLRGGKGSDTYTVSSAISKATRLTVNQADKVSGDLDTLVLNKANNANMKYSFNSSKNILTMTHSTGGVISVTNWTKNPLNRVQFSNGEKLHIIAGNNSTTLSGTSGNDYMITNSSNKTINAGAGNDTIRISGGTGQMINTGTGNDKVYVASGSVNTIVNSGGTDYIEIGKSAGNGIKVESVGSGTVGYKLAARETVKVLGGNSHDIKLYGGNDKIIIAGGENHTVYGDGPGTVTDGDDTIVIQSGGKAKKIVAGNGNDVIAIANGAGNGSTIYTGREDFNGTNSGIGHNKVNVLGGSDHKIYLGGETNQVMIEAQDVILNKYAGTVDNIVVRWSEEGVGTLLITCPSGACTGDKSELHIEGLNRFDFNFEIKDLTVSTGDANDGWAQQSLVMTFTGMYFRNDGNYSGDGRYVVNDPGNSSNSGIDSNPRYSNQNCPVYVNMDGLVQYNWCAGNDRFSYTASSVSASDMDPQVIEIARWGSYKGFSGITFNDGFVSFDDINTVANGSHMFLGNG